jgi:hypothetical protein
MLFTAAVLAAFVKLLSFTSPLVCTVLYILYRLVFAMIGVKHAQMMPLLFSAVITGFAAFGYFWLLKKLDGYYADWMWWVILLAGALLLMFVGI